MYDGCFRSYRYHIHQYNRDELILSFIAYHDSKIFVRLLQLLDLKKRTDQWNWLHSSAVIFIIVIHKLELRFVFQTVYAPTNWS